MANRVAFFITREETETYFGISSDREQLFEPHYNISVGRHIPVVTAGETGPEINPMRWGKEDKNSAVIREEELFGGENQKRIRCAVPISGFFVWKDNVEKGHPFFVRMMHGPVMSVAGVIYKDDKESFFRMATARSNVLVQPMTETMPMLLDRTLSLKWIDPEADVNSLVSEARKKFLLTDLSVMRVSKKVNDLKNNSAKLIQPIPK
jgi:putative SOS response-associated peptidase YedK